MKNISNKLISILNILTFILALSFAFPTYARTVTVDSGVNFNPYSYPYQYTPTSIATPVLNNNNYNGYYVIPGCEGRNTGYSTTSGQSCVGSYINPSSSSSSPKSSSTTTTKNTNNTASKTTEKSSNVATASDINESYGSLTANALLGSNSFMPSGLVQWIILAIIILAIIFLWRYVHAEEKYMSEPLKHA